MTGLFTVISIAGFRHIKNIYRKKTQFHCLAATANQTGAYDGKKIRRCQKTLDVRSIQLMGPVMST